MTVPLDGAEGKRLWTMIVLPGMLVPVVDPAFAMFNV
jgi:hypothetical protein